MAARRALSSSRKASTTKSTRHSHRGLESKARHRPASRGPKSSAPMSHQTSWEHERELTKEDAEIVALEKKLGILKKQTLPKSFKDDGLDELLEGLDSDGEDRFESDDDAQAWLDEKRSQPVETGTDHFSPSESTQTPDSVVEEQEPAFKSSRTNPKVVLQSSDESLNRNTAQSRIHRTTRSDRAYSQRENPYLPPVSTADTELKYIPPKLRNSDLVSEDLQKLEKQLRGLVNRLTEANMVSLLDEVEKLYRSNPRQHVTSTLTDLLIVPICIPTALPDTLILLSAGFISAVFKVIGIEFGACIIQRIVELFDAHYTKSNLSKDLFYCKEASNLMALLSELYNFQVISSKLLFDYIRKFLDTLSEIQVELLQRILRVAGPQLRQDDPASLKEIVIALRQVVAMMSKEQLSVRARFMIEYIEDLRSNKMKNSTASSNISSEHASRMKKTLGSLNNRTLRAIEPLRCGLQDVSQSDSSGRWWLVGSSWAGKSVGDQTIDPPQPVVSQSRNPPVEKNSDQDFSTDLAKLARQQHMNTDIRRAIFISIMSATDFQEAHARLLKLRLKKTQELEIPKVLMSCCGAETYYNPYYMVIAKRLCSDRRMRVAFRFGLWDLFKNMGEPKDASEVPTDEIEFTLPHTSYLVNLAKMFGALIADQALDLLILKNVNFSRLQPSTMTFIEVMLVTAMLRSQSHSGDQKNERAIQVMFSALAKSPHMMSGMLYFITKVVAKSDIAGGRSEMAQVKWISKLAIKQIRNMLVMNSRHIEA